MTRTKAREPDDIEDDDTDEVVARASKEIEEKVRAKEAEGAEAATPEEPTGNNVVDLDEPDDDEPKETVAQRKRNRYREQRDAAETARREAAEARAEAQREKLRADSMAAIISGAGQRQQQQESPIDTQIKALDAQNDQLLDHYARLNDQEKESRLAEFRGKQQQIERERHQLMIRSEMRNMPRPPAMEDSFMIASFPEVHTHARGPGLVNAHMQLLVSRGKPADMGTFREAAQMAHNELFPSAERRAPRATGAAPSALRSKLSYSGGHAAGGGAERPQNGRRLVDMDAPANKHHRQMARAMYPDLDEAKAFRTYAKQFMAKEE